MGDPRRLRPKYETPRKVWDTARIKEEQTLLEEYGLRNMRELWRMKQELKKIRREARRLLSLGEAGKAKAGALLTKVIRLGFAKPETSLEDLLSLSIRDILERRLETQVVKKGLAKSMKQARQLIVHGFIAVNGRKVATPSYIVPVKEENTIAYYKNFDLHAGEETPGKAAVKQEAKAAAEPAEKQPTAPE